jgi:hypothetical protein
MTIIMIMRTTLSIDEDVASLLSREIKKSGLTFKGAVNHYLRMGLMAAKQPAGKPFIVKPRSLGLPAGLSYDNVGELLEKIEGHS